MAKRIRLTTREIEALLAIAGDADAGAHVECYASEKEGEQTLEAFESGMNKLRDMLAGRGER